MNNIFFLLVIISFWNKYISIKWVQKAIFVTLGSILHTICLLLLTSKQISPFFPLWCFFFCLPPLSQCCWFAPFFCLTITAMSPSLGVAYISSLASQTQMCFFHQAKYACVGFAHTRCHLSLSHPSWCFCVTASLGIPVRRSGVGRGDEQCLPLVALPTNSGRKHSQSAINVVVIQTWSQTS